MLNEFKVVVVMNEAMIKMLRTKNKDCSANLHIKELLQDEAIFFKIKKPKALEILKNIGIKQDQCENVYKKLISPDIYYDLLYKKQINENDASLLIKYETKKLFNN